MKHPLQYATLLVGIPYNNLLCNNFGEKFYCKVAFIMYATMIGNCLIRIQKACMQNI